MNIDAITPYINHIITFDMVNGKELTTIIKSVNVETGDISCGKPLMFVPVPDQRQPNNMQIMALPYGHPLYDIGNSIVINSNHVITIFKPTKEQRDSYTKHSSNIIPASTPIDNLDNIDFSKFRL